MDHGIYSEGSQNRKERCAVKIEVFAQQFGSLSKVREFWEGGRVRGEDQSSIFEIKLSEMAQ